MLQAKIEPGNVNHVQLSPTIQATRSNYTQVHQGRRPHYLEYFQNVVAENILLDQLQSEQGSRFLKKRNRNMIIYVEDELDVLENFIWLTLKQIKYLMRQPNIVNMDTRTVISAIQFGDYQQEAAGAIRCFMNENGTANDFFYSAIASDAGVCSKGEIIHFLTGIKSAIDLDVQQISLNSVREWNVATDAIYRDDNRFFRVIGVDVSIDNREIARWQQPMIEPTQAGVCAFIVKKINGVVHFAVHMKMECGNQDLVEFSPTVQSLLPNSIDLDNKHVPFVDYVLNAEKEQVVFNAVLSEEGGRFFQEQNRYMLVLADESFPDQLPEQYIWMTLSQLLLFCQFNNYVNIQARSLISVVEFV